MGVVLRLDEPQVAVVQRDDVAPVRRPAQRIDDPAHDGPEVGPFIELGRLPVIGEAEDGAIHVQLWHIPSPAQIAGALLDLGLERRDHVQVVDVIHVLH
mgnify:CR=1 FL=1